ncbi:cation transporter [Polaribacter sp.]|nr:cation transporter [Polaribacter sp.]
MKIKNIIAVLFITGTIVTACKKDVKQEKVNLAISGMTCEIGCAKTIQSKLSKKEGVLDAKVIFTDSIATIDYDANTTSKEELIAFVDGIAGGELYSASETEKIPGENVEKEHACSDECKEKCEQAGKVADCCKEGEDGKLTCTEKAA